jgi:hypothetical protein
MAITSSINAFLQNVQNGVRPNLYLVDFAFPSGVDIENAQAVDDLSGLLCKAAALPASNLGVIEVPFRGRTVKIAGDRTFDTWTATFINDRNFAIRGAMEKWMEAINRHEQNSAGLVLPNSTDGYLRDILVKQLERNDSAGGATKTVYKLVGCFPTNISQIDLAYDSNDQIEDFTVEFQIQYWTRGDDDAAENVIAGAGSES